ncbi:MAG: hypothetical protein JWO23_301 [Solirubrobacterales bacterium]|nr:hypothetical protein [Solirubrobacterales bacterium]
MGAIIRSVAISATVATVFVWPLANADASTSFKTGTYKAKGRYTTKAGAIVESRFKVLLKRGSCAAAPSQPRSSTHLCVSLPVSPRLVCSNGVSVASLLGSFATPAQLLNSGKLFQRKPVTAEPPIPGAPPPVGESIFSVTFKKNGTASGSLMQRLTVAGTALGVVPCVANEPFTAKLG